MFAPASATLDLAASQLLSFDDRVPRNRCPRRDDDSHLTLPPFQARVLRRRGLISPEFDNHQAMGKNLKPRWITRLGNFDLVYVKASYF